jgi:hypothetical protein
MNNKDFKEPTIETICSEFLLYFLKSEIAKKQISRRLTIDEIDDIKKGVKNKLMEVIRNLDYDFEVTEVNPETKSYSLELEPINLYTWLFILDKIHCTKQSIIKDKKQVTIEGKTYTLDDSTVKSMLGGD